MAYHDPTDATDPSLPRGRASKRGLTLVHLGAALGGHAARTGAPARLTALLFGETVTALALPGGPSVSLDRRLAPEIIDAWRTIFRAQAGVERYTGIAAGLRAAAAVFDDGPVGAERHVILLTDGRESMVADDPQGAVRAAARAVHAVHAAGATLHVIGLSEQAGRLPDYLDRMRRAEPVLRRFVGLLDMTFAPAECRRVEGWSPPTARQCGAFFARHIARDSVYDPVLLDAIRRSPDPTRADGLFLHADAGAAFQRRLHRLVAHLTGRGVYATRDGERSPDGADPRRVVDTWRFDLDLEDEAALLVFNRDALANVRWHVRCGGHEMRAEDGVLVVGEAAPITRIELPNPARGVWIVERRGRQR